MSCSDPALQICTLGLGMRSNVRCETEKPHQSLSCAAAAYSVHIGENFVSLLQHWWGWVDLATTLIMLRMNSEN